LEAGTEFFKCYFDDDHVSFILCHLICLYPVTIYSCNVILSIHILLQHIRTLSFCLSRFC